MNMMQKILMIMGVAYIALGGTITVCFAVFGFPGPFLAIPLFFVILGIAFVAGVLVSLAKKKKIVICGENLQLCGQYFIYSKRKLYSQC